MDQALQPAPSHFLPPSRTGGVHRTRTSATTAPSPSVSHEKRKRSRVTADQLAHLERVFAVDRSPTAARRKEISEMLGMQERQTQIWFQNRRAKAKLHDTKGRLGSARNPSPSSPDTPPDTPPELSMGFEADLQSLTHESEPISIIPCTDLSIGSWRRISAAVAKYDLVAYSCPAKQCLAWFVHSDGAGFKMEVHYDTIIDTHFEQQSQTRGVATFKLSQPPQFFMEAPPPTNSPGRTRTWKSCTDWTAGQQASFNLTHELVGSASQLLHALQSLPVKPIIHSPVYPQDSAPSPVQLPLASPTFTFDGRPINAVVPRKRSATGPPAPADHNHPPAIEDHPDPTPSSAPFPSHYTTSYFSPSYPLSYHPPQMHHPDFASLTGPRTFNEENIYVPPFEEIHHRRLSNATTPLSAVPSASSLSPVPLLASGFDPGDRHSLPADVIQGLGHSPPPILTSLTMPFIPTADMLSPTPLLGDCTTLQGALGGLGDAPP